MPTADEVEELLPYLTPSERDDLDAMMGQAVGDEPLTFREYVDRVQPGYIWYDWNVRLAAVLQRVADDELKRVLVSAPPRHGKSEEISRLFTGYYLYRHPERWVGLSSYALALAQSLSRNARNYYRAMGAPESSEASAVTHWETGKGGGMWAAGVGGPLTGKGFHLGVIDDPTKNQEEALSDVVRQSHKDWYQSTFYTRREPDAAIVVIMTRWHGDDLVGWLLEQEAGEKPERWHIVDFPALAGEPAEWPATCTVEPDPRAAGEALCPERYSRDELERIRTRVGAYWFAAMYQGRPRPREGALFKRAWFDVVPVAPVGGETVRAWDIAASAGSGDWTVGLKMRRIGATFYVLDVVRGQWDAGDRDRIIKQTASQDGKAVRVRAPQDPGAAGKDLAAHIRRLLVGYDIQTRVVSGDKVVRANPMVSQAQGGNVVLVRGDWNKVYLDEVCDFPFGKNDDQADAGSDAFNDLAHEGPGRRAPVRWS
jgi:predicted phage terminase large subunit-like protein